MTPSGGWVVLQDAAKLLTFRISRERLAAFGRGHLLFGLVITWLVGIGRWWDDPTASALQKTGLGSVVYVFLLSGLLFLVIWPMKPRQWSYLHVLSFVSLTAPPALLYAIPVERFMAVSVAAQVNLWFLLLVAAWRVALLFFYCGRHAGLRWWQSTAAALLPLSSIVIVLSMLNLARGAVSIMGGLRDQSANQAADEIVFALAMLAFLAIGPLVVLYAVAVVMARRRTTPY